MSSEGISGVSVSDFSKNSIIVQAEVHSNAWPGDSTTDIHVNPNDIIQAEIHSNVQLDDSTTDTHVNSNGIEINSISPEDKVIFIPPLRQASKEATAAASSASGNPVPNSPDKEKDNTFVVQMTVGMSTRKKVHSTRMHSQRSLRRYTSLLHKGSSLSWQESWRTKSSGTRIKSKKNYISFHNITYTVPQGWFFQKKPPKVILNSIRLVANI